MVKPSNNNSPAAANAFKQAEYAKWMTNLKTQFNGTGKTFYIGKAEQDWTLYGYSNSPVTGAILTPNLALVNSILSDAFTIQNASDIAKSINSDVNVYAYVEVNFAVLSATDPSFVSIANTILPQIDIDMVFYSAYDSVYNLTYFPIACDHLQSQLIKRGNNNQRRVLVSEYGFALCDTNNLNCMSDAKQDNYSLEFLAYSIAWGSRSTYYWQVFNNEMVNGVQRGFWLQKPDGTYNTIYTSMVSFQSTMSSWVTANPTSTYGDFRAVALTTILGLANNTLSLALTAIPEDSTPVSMILNRASTVSEPTALDYNLDLKLFASGNIMSSYSVAQNAALTVTDPILRAAYVVLGMGFTGFKFSYDCLSPNRLSLSDQMNQEPYKTLFAMNFKSYIMVVNANCMTDTSNRN